MNYYKKYKFYRNISYLMDSQNFFKEVNFDKDIDEKKSGYYVIHELGLEFIYDKEKSVELVDYKNFSEKKSTSIKNESIQVYYIKDLLNEDTIIHLKFNSYNVRNGSRVGISLVDGEKYNNLIGIGIDNSKVWLSGNICGERLAVKPLKFKNNLNMCRDYIVDISHGKFYCDNIELGSSKFINYLNLKFKTILETFKGIILVNVANFIPLEGLSIGDLVIGNYGRGIIYLKPFILENINRIKMYIFYSGNIKVEILDVYSGEWLTFNNKLLKSEEFISLRIHLNSYDRIFSMIFVED